ncbi:hypothetical protein BDN70DRAFT_989038 [Pholiota conissans]|uniref:Uncharacterized protein n=1 Tax=Pholiota conissans TaxID=109636 RepID=A0A9P6CZH7_9AGAR|nr:hypothetical protein BDN70DRAFT_989038 [Pholiota conissans]
MLLPRFANPHFLPQLTETLSRAELYAQDTNELGSGSNADNKAIAELNRIIEQSLPEIRYDALATNSSAAGKKPHNSDSNIMVSEQEDVVLFRLVSSQSPHPLSLLPPPPPPSITREPDAEDSEEQALRRKQRAEVASVDGADILRESLKLKASSSKETIHMQVTMTDTEPCMMILRTQQSPRKTRPPVPHSQLSHFPYVSDASKMPTQSPDSKIPECLTLDAEIIPSIVSSHARRKRRRRGHTVEKERPRPQFWRPSPNLKGKCRGHAYGYPSNLSLAESHPNGGESRPWKYKRDTMKNGTYSDSCIGSRVTYGYGPNKR